MIEDDEIEEIEPKAEVLTPKRKRLMLLLLPLLVIIGMSVGIFFALNKDYDSLKGTYHIIQYNKDTEDGTTVFYDLPELKTSIRGEDRSHELRLKINLELSSVDDIAIIQALTPKLNDAVISHTIELTFDEVAGSKGLYWLKEELFYRFNLITSPLKIKNINFSIFELQ